MAERLEDLNLPNTVVGRLIKEALPEGVIVSKEARTAVGKAASVFIIYITANAVEMAQKRQRKTLTGADIVEALDNVEFNEFIEPLQEFWEVFKEVSKKKKEQKEAAKSKKEQAANESSTSNVIEIEDDEEEVMEVMDEEEEEDEEAGTSK